MESQGIIRRSKSSWSSPLHMVETTAEAVLDAFVATWVARFGISPSSPQTEGCSSPQPRGFGWCGEYGVQHITTTPFHPTGQWDGGEAVLLDEGRPTCQGWRRRLSRSSAVGHAGHQSLPQGGVWHVSG